MIKLIAFGVAALAGIAAISSPSIAATYVFDSSKADVTFTYYAGFIPQSGHFTQMTGILKTDPRSSQGSINAVIKTASLSASAWESELKGRDFFNIVVYPEIHFQSRLAKLKGMETGEFAGDLTINGVTQAVTLQGSLGGGRHVSAKTRIKRSACNMTALSFLVGDEIDIQIEADLLEK